MSGRALERALAVAIAVVVVVSTLGEGGSAPGSLLVWHALVVMTCVGAVLTLPSSRLAWPADVAISLGAFVSLFIAGWARAPQRYSALLMALELAAALAVGWLAWRSGAQALERWVLPFLVAGAVQGMLIVAQLFSSNGTRPAGTFLNPNHAGLWLVAVLLLAVGTSIRPSGGASRWAPALAIPAFAGVLATGSRGALVGLAAGGLVLVAFTWPGLDARRKKIALAVLVSAVVAAAIPTFARLADYDPFRYHRVKIWQASVESWLGSPWWGSGPGGFEQAASRFRFADGEGPLRYDKFHSTTHSDPLRVLAELGTPAALALAVAFVCAWRRILRAHRAGRLSPALRGAVAALSAIGVQALVDNPSRTAALYVLSAALWGVVLAATAGEASRERRGAPVIFSSRARAAYAALLVLGFLTADVAPYRAWTLASGLPRGVLDAGQVARLERAMELNPLHAGYPARWAEHVAAGPLALEAYARGREAAEKAVRLDPSALASWLARARLEAAACERRLRTVSCRENARFAYREAERRSPYEATIPLEAAMLLLDLGDVEGARLDAERALSLEPEAVLPRLVLADALLESGTEGSVSRAATLVDEAVVQAERWAAWSDRGLLRLDVEALARLRRRLPAAHREDREL